MEENEEQQRRETGKGIGTIGNCMTDCSAMGTHDSTEADPMQTSPRMIGDIQVKAEG